MKRHFRKRDLVWLWPVGIVAACVALPFALLELLVGLPILLGKSWWADRQYRRRMTVAGRVLSWEDAVERVRTGVGVILVDVVGNAVGHMWWSPVERSRIDPNGDLPSAAPQLGEFTDEYFAMVRTVRERLRTLSSDVWLIEKAASHKLRPGRLRQELGEIRAIAIEGLPFR